MGVDKLVAEFQVIINESGLSPRVRKEVLGQISVVKRNVK